VRKRSMPRAAMTRLLAGAGAGAAVPLIVVWGLSTPSLASGAASTAAAPAARAADPAIYTDTASVAPDPMVIGAPATYTVTAHNTSGSAESDVRTVITITDNGASSGGLTFGTLPAGCTATAAQVVTCTEATLGAGATATYDIPITVNPSLSDGVNFRLEAATTDAAGDTGGSQPGGLITQAHTSVDVAITKTGPARVSPGGTITYTITVTNNGPSDSPDTTWHDDTNGNLTTITGYPCGDTGLTVSCSAGTLAPGESRTYTITLTAKPDLADGTVIPNCAVVYTGKPDTDESNNTSCIDTIVGPKTPDSASITIYKTGPATVLKGGTITYTITVTNLGPVDAPNVIIADPLDTSFDKTTVSLPSECTLSDTTVVCALGTLKVNETRTLRITVSLRADATPGTVIMDCASATSRSVLVRSPLRTDEPPSSCWQTTVTAPPVANIAIVKSAPLRVNPDGTFTDLLQVTNDGPAAADDVIIHDPIDDTLFSVVSLPAGCGYSAGTVTCHLGTLAPEEIRDLDITLRAKPGTAGFVDENCAEADTTTDDPDTLNNESCADTIIGSGTPPDSDLEVTKDGPSTGYDGETVTYAISVTNHGPDAARDVMVVDPLDSPFVTATALPAECSLAGATVVCRASTVAVGETKTFVITMIVGSGVPPGTRIVNCASTRSRITLLRESPGSWCAETDVLPGPPPVPVTG